MKTLRSSLLALSLLGCLLPLQGAGSKPIQPHPKNPRYFQLRGNPTVLISSSAHYGTVINADFDFHPYLAELQRNHLNLVRTFLGPYIEPVGAFKIQDNVLAPAPGKYLAPWARSATPGFAGGGEKFDLTRWDDAFFARLKQYVQEAGRRGIVVEAVLFCPYYDDGEWRLSPINAANNVNGVGDVPRTEALTLKHPKLVEVEDAYVRKLVTELRRYDNVYFEICNEPYFGGVTLDWQRHVAEVIAATEHDLPAASRHMIAQNIANGSAKVADPNPLVALFNFHYAAPPDAVKVNWDLHKAIGFDETGFKGTRDLPYRTEGWEFLMAGGSVYDHLDYSFTVAHPDGTAPVTDPTPGGGGRTLRRQFEIMKRFFDGLPFVKMAPDSVTVKGGPTARCLSQPGEVYAVYVKGGTHAEITLELPEGRYSAEWVNTKTGATDKREQRRHPGHVLKLEAPEYTEDIALRVRRL